MISYTLYLGDLNQGEFIFRQARHVVVTAWKDERLVCVMSRNCNPTSTVNVKRKQNTIKQPLNIISYNKYMGGVDKADQLCSYYQLHMKSRKFYM